MEIITFTAEDEEPKCIKCDNINADLQLCKTCIKSGWFYYQRTQKYGADIKREE